MKASEKSKISMDIKEDPQETEYSNDDAILSKIKEIVKDEHIMNTIKCCFIEHKIKYCYFQNHKRKDLTLLLRKYKIKTAIALKLWAAFTNNNNENESKIDNKHSDKNNNIIPEADNDEFKDFANIHDKHRSVELIHNKYAGEYTYFASSVTESKFSNNAEHNGAGFDDNTENNRSIKYILYTLIRRYSHQYFDGKYEDIIKLLVFYYASIDILSLIHDQLSLNQINWNDLELIKSHSMNVDSINESVAITQKAMNAFCSMALERLNNNYSNNLIQIGKNEWILIVHVIDDDGGYDIGVSFKYNDKSENLFIATAIYLNEEEIESKHKLIGLKHNYCQHLRSFNLKNIIFIEVDEVDDVDDDDDDIILSS